MSPKNNVIFDSNHTDTENIRRNNNAPNRTNGISMPVTEEIQKKGKEDAATQHEKEAVLNAQKLDELTDNTGSVLLKVSGVFPFDFFPDELIIDVNRVNIIKREFFMSAFILSISIPDIFDVHIETSPFFSKIKIEDKYFRETDASVGFLQKHEAEKARRVIQGLLDANKHGVDLTKIDPKDLKERLLNLGKIKTSPENSLPN